MLFSSVSRFIYLHHIPQSTRTFRHRPSSITRLSDVFITYLYTFGMSSHGDSSPFSAASFSLVIPAFFGDRFLLSSALPSSVYNSQHTSDVCPADRSSSSHTRHFSQKILIHTIIYMIIFHYIFVHQWFHITIVIIVYIFNGYT